MTIVTPCRMLLSLCWAFPLMAAMTPSGPITISGQSGTTIKNLRITSANGPCVVINGSSNITIEMSEIGPCAGNAIVVSASSQVNIYDNYIHPNAPVRACCDNGDGIYSRNVTGIRIQGNVIAYGEANIEMQVSSGIRVKGNFLLNPRNGGSRGQHFQCSESCSDLVVEDNYMLSSRDAAYTYPANQEDAINLIGMVNSATVQNNYINGGFSGSGCGIIAEHIGTNTQILNNVLLNTGQCGIGIVSGSNIVVNNNRILNTTPVAGGGNSGIFVWRMYPWLGCGPITLTNNVVSAVNTSSQNNSYWNGGGCSPSTITGNVVDAAARALLTPPATKLPAPSIPPAPFACVIASPYTTQANYPSCDNDNQPDTVPPTVTVSSPKPFQAVSGTATFTAAATDNIGVVGVQFLVNGVSAGAELTTPPYTMAWTSTVSGTYTLTSIARDKAGNRASSPAISFTNMPGGTSTGNPSAIPIDGLRLWLRADQGVSAIGSSVSQWLDQSGKGVNANQAVAASQPTLAANSKGSAVLRFDGSQDFLNIPLTIEDWSPMTIVLVSSSTVPCTSGVSWAQNATISWDETDWWGDTYLSSYQNCVSFRFGTGQTDNTFFYQRPQAATGLTIALAARDGSTDSLYIGGSLVQSAGGKQLKINRTTPSGYLGRGIDNTYFKGDIAEVLLFDRTLTDAERQTLVQYLTTKYKL